MQSTLDYSHIVTRAASAAALLALCTACGGGSNSGPPPQAPAISAQPASLTVGAGSAASFSVAVSGSAPLSYQWKRNGADIAGATSASYTLSAAQLADTRSKWSVTVSNAAGSTASAEASLHVTGLGVWAGSVTIEGVADGAAASARFSRPFGLAFDKDGNLLVADEGNKSLRKITPAGQVGTLRAGFESGPGGIALDSAGNIYVLAYLSVLKLTPAGVPSVLATIPYCSGRGGSICIPNGIAVDAANNVYVASGAATRRIAPDGSFTLLEGDDGGNYMSTGSQIHTALAFDGKTSVYEVDTAIRQIGASGKYSAIASSGIYYASAAGFDGAGHLYYSAPHGGTVRKMTPAGVVTDIAGTPGQDAFAAGALPASLQYPRGLALDRHGDLYVTSGHAIVKIQLPPQ